MKSKETHAGTVLTIDLGAIRDNYQLLRARAKDSICAAVLKADAYGLGAARVAPVLAEAGCRHFFVAHLDEGIALRPQLPFQAAIFVLHGPMPGTEPEFARHGLIPVLNSAAQVEGWRRLAERLDRVLPAALQVDTGMSRLGLSAAEVDAACSDPDYWRGIELRFLMSHLACAERQDHPINAQQLAAFKRLRMRLPSCAASFANSSGIFLGSGFHFDLVRPGAALYGIAPVAGMDNPMKPVVRLQARVIQVRTIDDGDQVGYGLTYRAAGRRRIATVAVGYADGWLRSFSNRGGALVGGVPVPIVGMVSMDTCTLDVTEVDQQHVQAGAYVDLISDQQPVDAVATQSGTIGYEILTSLGQRYFRHYRDDGKAG